LKLFYILGLLLISNISRADFPSFLDCSTSTYVGQRNRLPNNTYGFCQISSCKDSLKSLYKNQCVGAPTVSFMPTKTVVVEGEGSFMIRAQLSRPSTEAVSFPLTTTESIGEVISDPTADPGTADFQISGSLSFGAGKMISDPMEIKLFKKPGFSPDRILTMSLGSESNQKISIRMVDSEQAPGNTYRVISSPLFARENDLTTPLQFGFDKPLSRIFPTRLKIKVGLLTYSIFVQQNQLLSDVIQIPVPSIPVGSPQPVKIESLSGTIGTLTINPVTYTAGFTSPENPVQVPCLGTVTVSGIINSCVRDYDHSTSSLSLCSNKIAPPVTYKSPAGTRAMGSVSFGTTYLTCDEGLTTGISSTVCSAGYDAVGGSCVNRNIEPTILTSGDRHTCFIKYGRVYCQGFNTSGGIGDGTFGTAYSPTEVSDIQTSGLTAKSVSSAFHLTCAIYGNQNDTLADRAYCWGDNYYLEIGNPSVTGGSQSVPVQVRLPTGLSVKKIAVGTFSACAIMSDSKLYCWGYNEYGQLGTADLTPQATPVKVSDSILFKDVEIGRTHTCGIEASGTLYCWGGNLYGETGNGSILNSSTPIEIDPGVKYLKVSAGEYHSCAITTASVLKCWGRESSGELGIGSLSTFTTPQVVNSGASYTFVKIGSNSTCAISSTAKLQTWGSNNLGMLGLNFFGGLRSIPQIVTSSGTTTCSAGSNNICAITDGIIQCAGIGAFGELGTGPAVRVNQSVLTAPLMTGVTP
jgi:alpha-tubulin suppressor-like RCC1 family protein